MTNVLSQKGLEDLFFEDFPQLEPLRGTLRDFEIVSESEYEKRKKQYLAEGGEVASDA